MGFDLAELERAVASHGTVARVVIAAIKGSTPREVGASMLVWAEGQSGTIGGGALEFEAARAARATLAIAARAPMLTSHPLGPSLGQCCGGHVTLLAEIFDETSVTALQGQDVIARPTGATTDMPLQVRHLLAKARNAGAGFEPQLKQGWMLEPLHRPAHPLWTWGAGHVGRALVQTFAPLPDFAITWIDTAPDRFPADIPANATQVPATSPATLVPHAPGNALHLILTYSHALDLELCHQLLSHRFAFAGLIGSASKWARFRNRLAALGHATEKIDRITCPIGNPALGKHPQAIAIGVASELLQKTAQTVASREETNDNRDIAQHQRTDQSLSRRRRQR